MARKNGGNLIKPCLDITKICKLVEKILGLFINPEKIYLKNYTTVLYKIYQIPFCQLNIQCPHQHRILILKQIIFKYLRIRVNYYETQKRQKTKKIRRVFTKMILFRNE